MRASGDVDQVVFALRVERIARRELAQPGVYAFEVPWIRELQHVLDDLGLRGNVRDVCAHRRYQLEALFTVQEFEAVDQQVFVLRQRNAWPPAIPAFFSPTRV